MLRPSLFVTLALAGCVQTTLSTFEQAPVVVIQVPGDGATFGEGEPIELIGKVADDGALTSLKVTWIDNGSTVLIDDVVPDAEGIVRFTTATLPVGEHAIALRAIDKGNLSAEANVGLTVVDVATDPVLTIVHPTTLEGGESGIEFIFEVAVSDPQGSPESVRVDLASDLDGDLCTMSVGSDGAGLCRAAPRTIGDHRLTFTATDTEGNVGTRSTIWPVAAVPEAPTITPINPTPGAFVLQDSLVQFQATVGDRQDVPTALLADLSSDLDGYLCPLTIDATGHAECFQTLVTMGNHVLTFRVLDPDGNNTASNVLVRVTDASGIDDDGDGFAETAGDCDDTNATVFPGGPELPDLLDNDCDGYTDEGTVLVDDDGDGYCESLAQPCSDGALVGDCNDAANYIHPGAVETCGDPYDSDCNGTVNDLNAAGCFSHYYDADQDGYGAAGTGPQCQCGPFGVYTSTNALDCFDQSAAVYPGAPELADGYDNDCDGPADEGTVLYDDDGDGYCETLQQPCTVGAAGGDCEDGRPAVNPAVPEVCNDNLDNDCDGQQNEAGAQGCTTFYLDVDRDGYGDDRTASCGCSAVPNAVLVGGDCDDANANINPTGFEAADGVDNDCDGLRDEGTNKYDDDGDGYCESGNCTTQANGVTPLGGDCNDGNGAISPVATEVCANGVDDNCNAQINEGQNAVGCTNYYRDNDQDNYGGGVGACYCAPTGVYTTPDASDCYDSNSDVYPGSQGWFGTQRGDGSFDYNCSGGVDYKFVDLEAVCEGTIPLPFPFGQIGCQFEPGWYGRTPACGQTEDWATWCRFQTGIIALLDACGEVPLAAINQITTVRQTQLCR